VSAAAFEACIAAGGVAVFPSDTVYGLACDPENGNAVKRLHALKGRAPEKPSAVMWFALEAALDALPELGPRTRAALERLLPGPVSLVVPNPRARFPLAAGGDPASLGVRVVSVPALDGVGLPVLQTSANLAGGPDPVALDEVPASIRAGAELVLDGGRLPGTPSSVVDLRRYEESGEWAVLRAGAVAEEALREALGWEFHFDPATYAAEIREEMPLYDRLQDELVRASGSEARRILELGTGTGETAGRLLARHPDARLVGIDVSAEMLAAAASALPAERVSLRVAALEDELPPGPFDLVASALCVHHLRGREKADLFVRVAAALAPGGRFVLGDVVVPEDPAQATTPLTAGYDHPSPVAEQLAWLEEAGLSARLSWAAGDLAVIVAAAPGGAGIVGP